MSGYTLTFSYDDDVRSVLLVLPDGTDRVHADRSGEASMEELAERAVRDAVAHWEGRDPVKSHARSGRPWGGISTEVAQDEDESRLTFEGEYLSDTPDGAEELGRRLHRLFDGAKREERIAGRIASWHDGDHDGVPLHRYLGWTIEEYARYVETCEPPAEREGAI